MSQVTWSVVTKHAQKQIDECRDALERASPDRIPAIQARIAIWREVIALPETLKSDGDASDKAGYN